MANDTDGRMWKGTIDQNRRGQAENVTGTRTKFGETDALLKASCRKVLRVKKNQKNKNNKEQNKKQNKKNREPSKGRTLFYQLCPQGSEEFSQ